MPRWILAPLTLVPACFHPSYDHPRCGSNGECPSGLTCSAEQVCVPGSVGCLSDKYVSLPDGNDDHLYLRGTSVELWHIADDACSATGPRAYLAVPDNVSELTALRTRAGSTFWIGVHDRLTEHMFVRRPTDTMAPFLPWDTAAGEPDNVGEQDCVTATATTISTEACDVTARVYLCECEP